MNSTNVVCEKRQSIQQRTIAEKEYKIVVLHKVDYHTNHQIQASEVQCINCTKKWKGLTYNWSYFQFDRF
jgi:hypothetical protein